MVAEKNCLHFWGQIATQVAKYVAEPILAPETRFRGIRWGNLHHFSRSIRSDWSWSQNRHRATDHGHAPRHGQMAMQGATANLLEPSLMAP